MSTMLLQLFLLSQSHVPPCRGVKGRDLLSNVAAENPPRGPQPPYDTAHHPWVTVARCSSWHACHWCRQANWLLPEKVAFLHTWDFQRHSTMHGGKLPGKELRAGQEMELKSGKGSGHHTQGWAIPPFLWDNTLTNFFLSWTSPFKEMVLYT